MEDLLKGINALNNNKAASLDDMLCEQINNFGTATLPWVLQMMDSIFPKLWSKSKVIAIFKPGKDSALPKNNRPISLLCHTYKLFERMVLNWLTEPTERRAYYWLAGWMQTRKINNRTISQLDTVHRRWFWAMCSNRNRHCWSFNSIWHYQPQPTT